MKLKNIFKIDVKLFTVILCFFIISLLTIGSAQKLLPSYLQTLIIKQAIWYLIGFVLAFFIMYVGNNFIYKNIWWFYGFGILTLIGLLIFAKPINESKCWFSIPGIGAVQPSEFMKIILIITLGVLINKFNEKYSNPSVKDEFIFLLKIGLVVLVPSILTFLQPDTGVVLIYILITITMLFISGIRIRWFIILGSITVLMLGSIIGIYLLNSDLFIKIFGTSFFLRIDRLLDWSNSSGYQLENGMSAIGAGGLFGYGFNHTPIYFPEPQTDFIFAVLGNNVGLIGSVFLLILITYFDIKLILLADKTNNKTNKYIIAGIVGMLLYQQIQNIGMTLGLIPITGITLPFISYGGSSLLSYMIMIGIIFNISKENIKYTN